MPPCVGTPRPHTGSRPPRAPRSRDARPALGLGRRLHRSAHVPGAGDTAVAGRRGSQGWARPGASPAKQWAAVGAQGRGSGPLCVRAGHQRCRAGALGLGSPIPSQCGRPGRAEAWARGLSGGAAAASPSAPRPRALQLSVASAEPPAPWRRGSSARPGPGPRRAELASEASDLPVAFPVSLDADEWH